MLNYTRNYLYINLFHTNTQFQLNIFLFYVYILVKHSFVRHSNKTGIVQSFTPLV